MDLQMYYAIIMVLWRMSVSWNRPSWSDIMQSTIILYESLLQRRLFVLEKRIVKPTMLICWQSRSRRRDDWTYVGALWFDLWGYLIWKTFLHDNIGWLAGGWFDNIFGMEHENTYIADSGITEDASLSFSTTLCSTEICIRWTWDNNILYRVASLHFINSRGALEFRRTHVCDVSV